MWLKKFLIFIIKNIIIIIAATLIFSSVAFDFPNLMKGVFGDIFAYASPDAQKQVAGKLAESCSAFDKSGDATTIMQVCSNRSLLESMSESCRNYRTLQRKGAKIENEEQVKEMCLQVESGEIDRACSQLREKTPFMLDFSSIGGACKEYKAGKISDREFFLNVLGSAFSGNDLKMPSIGILEKYNSIVDYLNNNKAISFAILAALAALLYLLTMDIRLFLIAVAGISFSLGMLIMLPYFGILAYEKFVGIDTTPILGSILGNVSAFDPKAIISVILLMFLRTYSPLIITLGTMFLIIGVAGKAYSWKLKRHGVTSVIRKEVKEEKAKKEKTSKEKQTKEEEDEAYRHRDRSAKEILEELDDIHKKKMKEKPENK